MDQVGIANFIENDVKDWVTGIRELRERGITRITEDEIQLRASELPEELDADLQRCALFELEVRDNDSELDPSQFESESSYCGWEPVFLSLDGESVIFEGYKAPSTLKEFRVAFYVHEWDPPGRLVSPWGDHQLPEFQPVPNRLWRLAPYSCVD
ncbi:MAG: hypothetical protein KF740_04265 [Ramlibacter sp.]|nr:hypothetical protein [Ramlibacter sp.]